jgi:hypothetical protein
MDKPKPPPAPVPALYLRDDGSLMLARGESTIELRLTVAQLLQLGVDALRVAVNLEPACVGEALAALENTTVQVPVETVEAAPCMRLN